MRSVCVLLLVASCNRPAESRSSEPSVSVAAPTATASEAPEPQVHAPGPPLGSYTSASCSERSYERIVTLGPGDAIEIADRVSPCPPGAQCIWSGIVVRSGTFTVEPPSALGKPSRVVISVKDAGGGKSQPPPSHFLWWESRGELTEPDDSCVYSARQ